MASNDAYAGLAGYAPAPVQLPEVRILRLEPGDVLVVNVPGRLTDDECQELGRRVKESFPDHRIAVLDGGATLDILRTERAEAGS
jgi:hypothetical protein